MVERETMVLRWEDVAPAARLGFSIWSGGAELEWAGRAWSALVEAGLARYRGELDRCRAAVRLLALAGIYSDFCLAAFDEDSPPDYATLAAELDVGPLRAGQLVGDDEAWDDQVDEEALIEDVVRSLADAARPEIVPVLLRAFGGVSGLFVALWRTTSSDDGADVDQDDDEILNDVTPEKLAAFAWLEEGCCPYR